jgi:NAD(P)-dependent dehydrogenase (short-subunit alcohol dehydrogenase family)
VTGPAAADAASLAPGRLCPSDYRYSPSVLDRSPEFAADVLYVVGGLYGNLAALDRVEQLAEQEGATVVFNGDFHWFDAEPAWFAEIEARIARHRAMRGNVETEAARTSDVGAGCGCAYPATVAEDAVRRSNEILHELRKTAQTLPGAALRLAALPMHLVADVGGMRVGIVHGDANALAGWSFAHHALDAPAASATLDAVRRAADIDVLASTHTCLAVLRDLRLDAGRMTIINNGAAGMPNFSGLPFGLISRIATTSSPHRTLYGMVRDGVHIDAIPIDYHGEDFLGRFLARWPLGSAAHMSYFERITRGPDYSLAHAALPRPNDVAGHPCRA